MYSECLPAYSPSVFLAMLHLQFGSLSLSLSLLTKTRRNVCEDKFLAQQLMFTLSRSCVFLPGFSSWCSIPVTTSSFRHQRKRAVLSEVLFETENQFYCVWANYRIRVGMCTS